MFLKRDPGRIARNALAQVPSFRHAKHGQWFVFVRAAVSMVVRGNTAFSKVSSIYAHY